MPSCPSFPPLNRKNEPVDFWNTTRFSCIHFFSSPLSYFRFSKFLICSYKFLTTPEIHPCTVPLTSIISFQVLLRYMYVSLCMVYVCVHATCVYVVYVSACVYSYVHTSVCMCGNMVHLCILWICVFMCTHMHVYVQKCGTSMYCLNMCIHMCTHTCICAEMWYICVLHAHVYSYVHMCTHCMYVCFCVYVGYVCIHICRCSCVCNGKGYRSLCITFFCFPKYSFIYSFIFQGRVLLGSLGYPETL